MTISLTAIGYMACLVIAAVALAGICALIDYASGGYWDAD